MIITTSKNTNAFLKKISKYLSYLLPESKYIPRAKTKLTTIMNKAIYENEQYILLLSYDKRFKKNICLNIYTKKENEYYLENTYVIRLEKFDLMLNKKQLFKIKNSINYNKETFYFINKVYYLKNSLYVIKENNKEYSFEYDNQKIGFDFSIVKINKV